MGKRKEVDEPSEASDAEEDVQKRVKLDEENVSSKKKKKKKDKKVKKDKKDKKDKKKKKHKDSSDVEEVKATEPESIEVSEAKTSSLFEDTKTEQTEAIQNLTNCSRVFLGNLHFKITDDALADFFGDCGELSRVDYLTDKETGNFYGSAFAEFTTIGGALKAVALAGQPCMKRPIKVRMAPPKEGAMPLSERANMKKSKDIFAGKELSARPPNCTKLFLGNLSFDIDDDVIVELFKDCGEIVGIRWLSHRDSGDFKGCGFVTFTSSDAVDKAVLKNGDIVLGRPIRIDYSD